MPNRTFLTHNVCQEVRISGLSALEKDDRCQQFIMDVIFVCRAWMWWGLGASKRSSIRVGGDLHRDKTQFSGNRVRNTLSGPHLWALGGMHSHACADHHETVCRPPGDPGTRALEPSYTWQSLLRWQWRHHHRRWPILGRPKLLRAMGVVALIALAALPGLGEELAEVGLEMRLKTS